MKRRTILVLVAVAAMVTVAVLAAQKKPSLLLLDWASKGSSEAPPVAVLIEMGLKDTQPTPWKSKATVSGAKVVKREGYRFRDKDTLADPDGWDVSSHWAIRAPRGQPAVTRQEGVAAVGVVLHLADVKPDATLTVEPRPDGQDKPAVVALKDVLAGKTAPVWDGAAAVRLVSTATPVVTAKTEDDFPAAAYGPDGTLWLAYISYTVKDESRRVEQQPFKEQPADFKALFTPEFGDQLFVKYYRDGKWSDAIAITGPKEDLVRCALAVENDGTAWVVYSANRNGRYDLFGRALTAKQGQGAGVQVEPEQCWTARERSPNLSPVACTDQDGRAWISYQAWNEKGVFTTVLMAFPREKRPKETAVSRPKMVNINDGNCWHPAIAASAAGEVSVAFDTYENGDYDVAHSLYFPAKESFNTLVVKTSRFEARPSIAYDSQGRLWIAYEEGPELWGKDYGAQDSDDGNPLYNSRSVRVVCVQDGKLFKPAAELPTAEVEKPKLPFGAQIGPRYEKSARYAYPKIGLDGKGRVWLTYRQKFGTRYSSHPGSYWLTFARRLDGDHWTEPIEVHHSDGLLDHRPVLLPHAAGGLLIVHNTDGRYTTPDNVDNQIYTSYLDLPGDPVEPKLVPHEPGKKDDKLTARAKEEAAAVKFIREYRVEVGGKKYQPLRGEFHRHTEISWDGGPDGSLEDMFRYAIDAAAMDWIGNGDHDYGGGREYTWWLIQKYSDAYHVKGAFTPMFTYERSVAYPHGHRNCMFAKRGVRTLPRLADPDSKEPAGIHADDTKMLYRYLKELDGICAVHTSATSMGTDWRDNDPLVEPLVEIYQGDRMSYEHEEAPRAGYDPMSKKEPANVAGWYPKGFINLALAKGYRLGFQSSSDHWSTHISYCIVLAEKNDRDAILDAVKKRHVYGATDDIILDVRSGEHVMGDELKSSAAPVLQVAVVGTAPLAKIDVLRDSEVVETLKSDGKAYRGRWTDPKPQKGVHYYYVRVQQADGELAWASPLWIDYAP